MKIFRLNVLVLLQTYYVSGFRTIASVLNVHCKKKFRILDTHAMLHHLHGPGLQSGEG